MKLLTLMITFCYLLITVSTQANDEAGPQLKDLAHTSKETRILHRLLQMEDHELIQLRQTIERIEKMSPEEKAALRARISKIHQMSPDKVDELRRKYRAIPREQRRAMRARLMETSPKERARLRSELRTMTPEERQNALREKGILPPHPNEDEAISPSSNNRNDTIDEAE